MQREGALITPARVVALGVGEFAIPTLEVHLGNAVDIALPASGAQCVTRAPQFFFMIRRRLRYSVWSWSAAADVS